MAERNQLEKQALAIWQRLHWQYRLGFALKLALIAATILLLLYTVCQLLSFPYLYILPVFLAVSGFMLWQNQEFLRRNSNSFTDFLNHRYQWLEFSTGLIPILPEQTLQSLQRQRVMQILVERRKEIKVLPNLTVAGIAFIGVLLLYCIGLIVGFTHSASPHTESIAKAAIPVVPENVARALPQIASMQIEVKPPSYTRQASFFAKELSVEAPEGSTIAWKCRLTAPAEMMQVIWNGKDTISAKEEFAGEYNWQMRINTSLFYQIRYGHGGNWYTSPVYTLIAKDDLPPVITVQAPEPYTFILYGQQPQVQVSIKLADDYGLQGAYMVATVSRGSGESVKFREEKLTFNNNITGKKEALATRLLNFNQLKMEPGDELYFYTESWDAAKPPQKTRSDTYFVQWEDTTSGQLSVMAGLSLDNMPAYFRSQRQIIIDTEKLIRERSSLSETVFRERSNNLGVDQKVLRLRYGQFLGEEFETTTGGGPNNEEAHGQEEGKDHEHEESEHAEEHIHNHEEAPGTSVFGDPGDQLKNYSHRHDTEEAATLFDDAIKAQLKAALAQMWEAELRLRTLRPKEALTYEYKALELIKSIQQKNRVYVERVGFEPPPLKPAENRLTGELDEVTNPKRNMVTQATDTLYPAIRKAIAVLERIKNDGEVKLASGDIHLLEKASAELAAIILQQPGVPVSSLNTLSHITAGHKVDYKTVARLQERLIQLLPRETNKPNTGQKYGEPELDLFVKELMMP